jgi:hypothetical protein
MYPETEAEFTPACPLCRGTGVPLEVRMQSGERVITYRCSSCQKPWTVTNREFLSARHPETSSR